jgi:hypothetical protein
MRLEDAHEAAGSVWEEFWILFTDPAHAMTEIAMSIVWDVLILTVIYQLLVKRYLYPRWVNRVHSEIDEEHGVDHNAAHVGTGTNGSHVKVLINDPPTARDGDFVV